jgi:hypothetical protein
METLGTARLTNEVDPRRAVVTSVARDEIAEVLRDPDAQPELRLDIRDGEELGSISMAWSRDELEDILARATGEKVILTFDRDELADAFADVEAHGLRQKALVFTVAAAGALGSGVGIANAAQFADVGGSAASAPAPVTSPGHRANPDLGAQVSRGAELSAAPSSAGTIGLRPNPDLGAQVSRGAELSAPSSSGEVFGIQRPDATDTFLVGGVLLAIAGASFAARRTLPTKPA